MTNVKFLNNLIRASLSYYFLDYTEKMIGNFTQAGVTNDMFAPKLIFIFVIRSTGNHS